MTDQPLDADMLKNFSPLDGLKRDNLAALARKVQLRELSPGQVLFKEGDTEKRTFYVVSAQFSSLSIRATWLRPLRAAPMQARNPVSPVFPSPSFGPGRAIV